MSTADVSQADKTVASASGGFSFFGGREDKYQEAVDLYIQAANAFRLQNQSGCLKVRPGQTGRVY